MTTTPRTTETTEAEAEAHSPTADPPILPFSAAAAPLVALAVAAVLGPTHGLATAVGSVLVLFNLWLLSILGPRIVYSLSRDEPPTLWLIALFAKFLLLIGAFFALFQVLPAFGLLLGFAPMMLGALAVGVRQALADSASAEVS